MPIQLNGLETKWLHGSSVPSKCSINNLLHKLKKSVSSRCSPDYKLKSR